jgi:hypothetical protein
VIEWSAPDNPDSYILRLFNVEEGQQGDDYETSGGNRSVEATSAGWDGLFQSDASYYVTVTAKNGGVEGVPVQSNTIVWIVPF